MSNPLSVIGYMAETLKEDILGTNTSKGGNSQSDVAGAVIAIIAVILVFLCCAGAITLYCLYQYTRYSNQDTNGKSSVGFKVNQQKEEKKTKDT